MAKARPDRKGNGRILWLDRSVQKRARVPCLLARKCLTRREMPLLCGASVGALCPNGVFLCKEAMRYVAPPNPADQYRAEQVTLPNDVLA